VAETLGIGIFRMSALTRLCMNCAEAEEWERAHRYALETIAVRESQDAALFIMNFPRQYETEALLRGGDESLARAEVQRLEEGLGSNRRFRIPYLRSKAVLAAWEGHSEQAIGHLHEAAQLAADLGIPGEHWQIQAALGSLYEVGGEQGQAYAALGEAARIIQGLAEGIKDETLRARFLAGPQIQPVLQHARDLANPVPRDHE
jgi:tetratricopeptide (TPR) repeat protein